MCGWRPIDAKRIPASCRAAALLKRRSYGSSSRGGSERIGWMKEYFVSGRIPSANWRNITHRTASSPTTLIPRTPTVLRLP